MNGHTGIRVNIPLPGELNIERAKTCRPTPKVGKIRQFLRFFGPAFIVSVAYIDPGKSLFGTILYAIILLF